MCKVLAKHSTLRKLFVAHPDHH